MIQRKTLISKFDLNYQYKVSKRGHSKRQCSEDVVESGVPRETRDFGGICRERGRWQRHLFGSLIGEYRPRELKSQSNETRKWKGDHFPPLHLFKPLDFTRPRGAALDRARFGSLAGRRSLGVSSRATSADRRLKVGHDGVLLSRDVAEKERHDLDGTEEEDEQHQVNLE